MNLFETKKAKFISHRGFTPMAPENSLPSFYYAGLFGQWAIETDVHLTKDGEIVCCHNASVGKYCREDAVIAESTYAALCALPIQNGARAGCFTDEERRIPKFSEYLGICRRFGSVPFIELKTDDTERVIHALKSHGFSENEVVMSSTVFSRLRDTRLLAPEMFLHLIFAEEETLLKMASLGNAGVSLNIPDSLSCPPETVDAVHASGLKLCLRAADSLAALANMRRLGLDYFPTNVLCERETEENR